MTASRGDSRRSIQGVNSPSEGMSASRLAEQEPPDDGLHPRRAGLVGRGYDYIVVARLEPLPARAVQVVVLVDPG